MLETSNYKVNDVVTIKLSNGEEIVGKLTEDSDNNIRLTRPLVFTLNPQSGQAMLVPWLMSVDPENTHPITLNRNNILAITKTIKEISDNYTQATSKIVPASASMLNGLAPLK
jgi:hypothetical protein